MVKNAMTAGQKNGEVLNFRSVEGGRGGASLRDRPLCPAGERESRWGCLGLAAVLGVFKLEVVELDFMYVG